MSTIQLIIVILKLLGQVPDIMKHLQLSALDSDYKTKSERADNAIKAYYAAKVRADVKEQAAALHDLMNGRTK